MKIYSANNELVELLQKYGLLDYASENEKSKGKNVFKHAKADKKCIVFQDENIIINPSGVIKESLTQDELKLSLLYCTLITNDFKEISPKGELIFEENMINLDNLQEEYILLSVSNITSTRKVKLKRVFEALETIESCFID